MRIAIITTGFAADETDYGGAAAILNTVRRLSEFDDLQIIVFALYYPVGQPCYEIEKIRVYSFAEFDMPSKVEKLTIWGDCKDAFRLEHQHSSFDIIHSMWSGESGHVAAELSSEFDIPMVTSICGGELAAIKEISFGSQLKFFQRHFVNEAFKQAKAIVCSSDYIVSLLKQRYDEDISGKAVKLPFGVDTKVFFPRNKELNPKAPVLINIANAAPVKGHNILFRALRVAAEKYPEVILRCYGRDDEGSLQSLVKKAGVEKNVELSNFIDYEHIPAALADADIFALSSFYESENMAMIEAAFMGLPVVSTRVGSAEEITTYLANVGDYETLGNKIIEAIRNPSVNYSNLSEKFSLDSSAKQFHELYKSLLVPHS